MRRFGTVLFLVATASLACAQGRLIVCGDEWTLSDNAFANNGASTNAFALNVAQALVGPSGSILRKSSNGIFNGASLGTALTTAGYTFTDNASALTSLAQLTPYNAVFLAGLVGSDAVGIGVLTSYLLGGGNVYIGGGTGQHGSAALEAAAWNPLTTLFGITIGGTYYNPPAVVHVVTDPGSHPLRVGVPRLTYGFGHDLTVSGGATVAIRGNPDPLGPNIGMVAMSPVPEPMTMTLAAVALGAAYRRRRRAN